jgi:hypothetical protein
VDPQPHKPNGSAPARPIGADALDDAKSRQTSRTKTPEPSPLTPKLKGFIDRVVVPILVKGYVEKLQNEKSAAESGENAATSALTIEAGKLEVPR